MSECPRCLERGKTWEGDDPVCAFDSLFFSVENWNCATSNALRELVENNSCWNDDQKMGTTPISNGRFLVISWYKNRGRVEGIWIVDAKTIHEITLDEAEQILSEVNPDDQQEEQ